MGVAHTMNIVIEILIFS